MTSNCAPAERCARFEDDAGKHLLTRTCADFCGELIRRPDGRAACPFFIDRNEARQAAH
jgi:hypothetical protein